MGYFVKPTYKHERVLGTKKEVNAVYYTTKVSPSEKVYLTEQDGSGKWIVTGPHKVISIAITHDLKLGLAVVYHLNNGSWVQETIDVQDRIHTQPMQARAACYWRQKGVKKPSIQGVKCED